MMETAQQMHVPSAMRPLRTLGEVEMEASPNPVDTALGRSYRRTKASLASAYVELESAGTEESNSSDEPTEGVESAPVVWVRMRSG